MYQYIVKRLLLVIPTLFGAAVLVFLLLRLIPGDICDMRLAGEGGLVDEETLNTCRAVMGIDKSLWLQFVDFIWGFIRFDLGTSMWTGQPISHEIGLRFHLSLQVAIMAKHMDRLFCPRFQHRRHRHTFILAGYYHNSWTSNYHAIFFRNPVDATHSI